MPSSSAAEGQTTAPLEWVCVSTSLKQNKHLLVQKAFKNKRDSFCVETNACPTASAINCRLE